MRAAPPSKTFFTFRNMKSHTNKLKTVIFENTSGTRESWFRKIKTVYETHLPIDRSQTLFSLPKGVCFPGSCTKLTRPGCCLAAGALHCRVTLQSQCRRTTLVRSTHSNFAGGELKWTRKFSNRLIDRMLDETLQLLIKWSGRKIVAQKNNFPRVFGYMLDSPKKNGGGGCK